MIIFIIPLKSSKVSKSWTITSLLLERTLKSICKQTCNDFRVIVVCNERPIIEFTNPFVEYIEVSMSIPSQDWYGRNLDKSQKILIGIDKSKYLSPSHIMVVDADDLVSSRIASFVKGKPNQDGWLLSSGYIHEFKNKFLYYLRKDFANYCGTSIIIKADLFPYLFKKDIYCHTGETLSAYGLALPFLPFCGAIYSRGNGENVLATDPFYKNILDRGGMIGYLKHLTRFRLITSKIRREFGWEPEIVSQKRRNSKEC